MQVDFYHLSRDPVEAALPAIARRVKETGQRLLVVSGDGPQREVLDRALWEAYPQDFLAHGMAGEPHDARQPLLLADNCDAANGARFVALADGRWRDDALAFDRVFLFFDEGSIADARNTWRSLGEREDVERRFWKQDGKRWVQGP